MQKRFIRMSVVQSMTGGKSKSGIYGDPTFPRPIKDGRSSYWVEDEVQAWIANKIAATRCAGGNSQTA